MLSIIAILLAVAYALLTVGTNKLYNSYRNDRAWDGSVLAKWAYKIQQGWAKNSKGSHRIETIVVGALSVFVLLFVSWLAGLAGIVYLLVTLNKRDYLQRTLFGINAQIQAS